MMKNETMCVISPVCRLCVHLCADVTRRMMWTNENHFLDPSVGLGGAAAVMCFSKELQPLPPPPARTLRLHRLIGRQAFSRLKRSLFLFVCFWRMYNSF